jgi:hypothetical protein
MNFFRTKRSRLYSLLFVVLAIAAMSLFNVGSAFADSGTNATATVAAGTLSESGPGSVNASAIQLNGTDQTSNYNLILDVNDPTGSGNGWKLTITSTTFTTGSGQNVHNLSNTASTVASVSSVCQQGTCTNPTNSVSSGFTLPAGSPAPAAAPLFDAAANTGMGEFDVTAGVNIAIPANTYAGTYASTVSVAIVSGP